MNRTPLRRAHETARRSRAWDARIQQLRDDPRAQADSVLALSLDEYALDMVLRTALAEPGRREQVARLTQHAIEHGRQLVEETFGGGGEASDQ